MTETRPPTRREDILWQIPFVALGLLGILSVVALCAFIASVFL